jgi:hypothetical protein
MNKMRGIPISIHTAGKMSGRPVESSLLTLAEDLGEAFEGRKSFCPPSPPYRSRFGDGALNEVPKPPRAERELFCLTCAIELTVSSFTEASNIGNRQASQSSLLT